MQDLPAQNPTYQAIAEALSTERLSEYRISAGDSDADVLARYLWNIALGDALWSSLHIAEVVLRNKVHRAIRGAWGPEWFDDPEIVQIEEQREDISKAKSRLVRAAKQVTESSVVAELDFGFWTGLLRITYETGLKPLWPGLLVPVFPNLNPLGAPAGRGKGRAAALSQLDLLRKLRNRISHHEPIWRGQKVGGPGAPRRLLPVDHRSALEVISWMSAEMRSVAARIDEFQAVFDGGYAAHLAAAGDLLNLVPPPEMFPDVPEIG